MQGEQSDARIAGAQTTSLELSERRHTNQLITPRKNALNLRSNHTGSNNNTHLEGANADPPLPSAVPSEVVIPARLPSPVPAANPACRCTRTPPAPAATALAPPMEGPCVRPRWAGSGGVGGGAWAACWGNSNWMLFHRAVLTFRSHPERCRRLDSKRRCRRFGCVNAAHGKRHAADAAKVHRHLGCSQVCAVACMQYVRGYGGCHALTGWQLVSTLGAAVVVLQHLPQAAAAEAVAWSTTARPRGRLHGGNGCHPKGSCRQLAFQAVHVFH